jgi:uncharacterized membrane protein YjjB (DUF3815 family)|uniref:threonine/serine exporter family protein n=1 Tax=Roseburia faecis TaxID=301302 RepID=UPI0040290A98
MSYVLQFFIAAVATVTFAILFAAPKKELVFCGVSGGLAWLVYFILYRQSGNVVLGSLVATFVLTILSRILAVARCNPATIYLVSGIFPLVPGAGIYYTAYYLISGMPAKCSAKGLETFEIALAIVFGIIFGFSIPEALFHKRKQ